MLAQSVANIKGVKNLHTLEAVAMGEALEELERPKAELAKKSGKSADGQSGGRGNKKPSENFTEGLETRDKVGQAVGMSGITYQRGN
jgi:hypothetical protein